MGADLKREQRSIESELSRELGAEAGVRDLAAGIEKRHLAVGSAEPEFERALLEEKALALVELAFKV